MGLEAPTTVGHKCVRHPAWCTRKCRAVAVPENIIRQPGSGYRVAMNRCAAVEDLLMRLMPPGAHPGDTWFGRMGDVAQQPPVWAGIAAVLALGGGSRGRRAALRGGVCYGTTAVVANLLIKPIVARDRPPGSGKGRTGPITSSFPSGHAATDLAFTVGVAQEIPLLFVPLALATSAAHWSLIRSRGHYPSDVLAGGFIGVGIALAIWRLWPSATGQERREEQQENQERFEGGNRVVGCPPR